MSYSIQTLQNDLVSAIHGTTANKIPNIYGIHNRAARQLLLDVDPKETQRVVQLAQVFNSVFDYAAPVDVKGDRVIDIRPQAGRKPWDVYPQGYSQNFDANKGFSTDNKLYVQWNTGVKSLRIEAPSLTAPVTLTDTSTITGWVATPGASTITLDSTNNVAGGGALVFNLLAGQATGYIENSSLTPLDLTAHLNISTLFLWVYMPAGASITNVNIRWGTSSTAYYSQTATVRQDGTAFQNGWNLLAFPWVSATTTGSPTVSACKYVRATFTYDGTLQTGIKIDNLTSNLGYIFEAVYYSKYLFRNPSTNAFKETVTDITDLTTIINLDTESYNLFFDLNAMYVSQSLQGADAAYDMTVWQAEYDKNLARYKAQNLSETMLKGESYYSIPKKGYQKFTGPYRQSGT